MNTTATNTATCPTVRKQIGKTTYIVRVGDDNEQGRAAIPQQIQFHFIVGHKVTQLRNVKGG